MRTIKPLLSLSSMAIITFSCATLCAAGDPPPADAEHPVDAEHEEREQEVASERAPAVVPADEGGAAPHQEHPAAHEEHHDAGAHPEHASHHAAHSEHGGHGDFMGLRMLSGMAREDHNAPLWGMGLSFEHPHLLRGVDLELVGAWLRHEEQNAMEFEILLKHPFHIAAHDEIFIGAGPAALWNFEGAVPSPGLISTLGYLHWFGPHLGASLEADYALLRGHHHPTAHEMAMAVSVSWRFVAAEGF